MRRLHSELVTLFGRRLVDLAEALDITSLDVSAARMEAIQAATEALLADTGHPDRQRATVAALDTQTALLLCMWIMDTHMFEQLAA